MMNIDTWAVVLATAAGPIGAVALTFWRESRANLRARRLQIFRTLMATRQIPVSLEHVNSLNLIEVDFYGCANVQKEWVEYKGHLFSLVGGGVEDDLWRDKKERLLANLLCEMAKTLHYNIPAMEIFRGGYAPRGWVHTQTLLIGALQYVQDLATVKKAVPMWLHGTTLPTPSPLSEPVAPMPPPTSLPPIE